MSNALITILAAVSLSTPPVIVSILCAVVAANLGLFVFNGLRTASSSSQDNTPGGIFFAAISVLYSLILAFVIMAEWDNFNRLDEAIASEGNKLNNILAHSANLPDTLKATIGGAVAAYCSQVINQKWTVQERRTDHPSAIPLLRHLLLTTTPANAVQENVLRVPDDDLSAISDLRRERLSHTHSQLPLLVWGVLETGAVMLVVFCYFFQVATAWLQRINLIYKEALNNIAKYAGAQNVWISLAADENRITLQIRDDGKGFDPEHNKEGNGLANMQQRAAALHGKLAVVSGIGQGTEITLAFTTF